jgi:hypothetical protein
VYVGKGKQVMKYKFKLGDLVRVRLQHRRLSGELVEEECDYLGLVTDRQAGPGSSAAVAWYKILIQGRPVNVREYELTKVSENNEL